MSAAAARRDALVAQLELQRGQDRDQVGVAAALAVAVHRPLDQPRAGVDGGERVGDPALGVVVGVDADLDALAERRRRRRRSPRRSGRQAGAVRVAEGDVLGAGGDRGAQALERVAGVVAPAVEEVLGVVDRPACPAARQKATESAIIARFSSRETLVTFSRCRAQVLPTRVHDRARSSRPARAAPDRPRRRRRAGGSCRRRRRARCSSSTSASSSKSSASFGLELGKPASMKWTPSRSSACDDADLLGGRQRHALALHAVAQGRVVELYLCPSDAFRFEGTSERACAARACAARPRQPLGGCGANSLDCLATAQHQELTLLGSGSARPGPATPGTPGRARAEASSNFAWITCVISPGSPSSWSSISRTGTSSAAVPVRKTSSAR